MSANEGGMKHQTRRSLRVVLTLVHVIIQLLLIGYIYLNQENLIALEAGNDHQVLIRVMIYIGIMIGVFGVYYSLMKLLSRRNIPE